MLTYFKLANDTYNINNKITFFYNTKALSYNKTLFKKKITWQINAKHIYLNTEKLINAENLLFCYGLNSVESVKTCIDSRIIHSKHVSKSKDFLDRSQKIVIIGNGASGCDILNYIYKQSKNSKIKKK